MGSDGGASQFALPLMLASIHQLPAASLGDGSTATITLIARRAVQRVGTRHWRRGADPEVPPLTLISCVTGRPQPDLQANTSQVHEAPVLPFDCAVDSTNT